MAAPPLRVFHVAADRLTELAALPEALPASGFLWIGAARGELESQLGALQDRLQRWEGGPLVDLHVSDLLNPQLPSQHDYTSWYDLLVFRRLAAGQGKTVADSGHDSVAAARLTLDAIDTSPVGFAVFDHVLLTVHPPDCAVRDYFAQRLLGLAPSAGEGRTLARLPASPADLMLRMLNHMVDSYLDLRRLLTKQLGYLQQELLDPRSRVFIKNQ